jgi:hypothetical protein
LAGSIANGAIVRFPDVSQHPSQGGSGENTENVSFGGIQPVQGGLDWKADSLDSGKRFLHLRPALKRG